MSETKKMLIGYHCNTREALDGSAVFFEPHAQSPVDFILAHTDPTGRTVAEDAADAEKFASICKDMGVEFIANFEKQNFVDVDVSADGHDWANRQDGTHLLNVPKEYTDALNSRNNCMGIMYDEFEHVIINRNISLALDSKFKIDKPAFPLIKEKDAVKQAEVLDGQLKTYADGLKADGAKTVSGEHVWPVLFHKFAKNGIIPNFKSQKESFSNVQFAIAAGAAKQYKTHLWNCVDLWYRLTFPGHSPEELYHNLLFSYLIGTDLVYVESSTVFFDTMENGQKFYNEYGKQFSRFANEYKGKERGYNVQDYRPEVGIVRMDDSFWGQGRCRFMWRNMLFGNPKIKPDSRAKEWIKAFRLITHGETGRHGISWGGLELHSLTPHRSFASMNSPVVYDENAKKEDLESLKLCFLCGYKISPDTMKAVMELVKENGLTVVCPTRFAPLEVIAKAGQSKDGEAHIGKGTWIITDDLKSAGLRKRLAPFLGKKGEMRFTFKDRELKMKISENGETFELV